FQKEQSLGNSTYLTYTDNSGQRIIFSYLQGNDSTSLFMAADYTEVQSIQIGSIKADFYQASQETSPKVALQRPPQKKLNKGLQFDFDRAIIIYQTRPYSSAG